MEQAASKAVRGTGKAPDGHRVWRLFRFTLRPSILLASVLGLIVVVYAYVLPQFAP